MAASDDHPNPSLLAIRNEYDRPPGWVLTETVPFSSARKWSAATFRSQGTWVLGAPELVWASHPSDDPVRRQAEELASGGQRVLLVAKSDGEIDGETLPPDLRAIALICLEERVRDDAAETLEYFASQGVALKVISGDSPHTVGAVARRVGVPGADAPFDARELPDNLEELAAVLDDNSVFGRVTPHQKRAIVAALQSRGHVVAMTGDGVNDALALKDADIGIAMGNGSPATRSVAQVVLLDGRFATLPGVVAEGRRVIANIERVANLFVTKTVYAMLLAIAVGFARWEYPFLPRHLTVVSSLTIGIPAFFIALEPNVKRYQPGFVKRVLRIAIPCGFVAAAATFTSYAYARHVTGATLDEARTAATLTLLIAGLYVLVLLARPLTKFRAVLVLSMIGIVAILLAVPGLRHFYALDLPPKDAVIGAFLTGAVAIAVLELGWIIYERRLAPEDRVPRFAASASGYVPPHGEDAERGEHADAVS
jgi:cation-transporting P-type ATPase E